MEEIFKIYKDTRYNPSGALWEVSNFGNLRKNGELCCPYDTKNGYYCFGKGAKYYVHRAVAELFIPNPDPEHKKSLDHINRDKHDNRAENLRWSTQKENVHNNDWEKIIEHMKQNIWVKNESIGHVKRIHQSELNEYISKGYTRGRSLSNPKQQ